jgi:hypothetical protein
VTFNPDVAAAALIPMAANPMGVGVGWLDIVSGNPHVTVAVPTVIAVVPGPAWVLVGWGRDYFNAMRRGRADTDDNLGLCNACNK